MTVSRRLRGLLEGPRLGVLLEAHDPLSATLVERAGVEGIWASSLTFSASWGLPDRSVLPMDHALHNLEHMARRVSIPILFDGDTGYGDHNHFVELVRRLCLRGVAGVCIEDKCFPKQNSFRNSAHQQLEDPEVFAAKLRAGLDTRPDPDFVIIARTEALIVGRGLDEALARARLFADAGVGAVVIHSKHSDFGPVEEFLRGWDRPTPLVCIPTTYANTPIADFERAGVSAIIWANHVLRASLLATRRVAEHIARHRSPVGLELASLDDIYDLQDVKTMDERDRIYRPTRERRWRGAQR